MTSVSRCQGDIKLLDDLFIIWFWPLFDEIVFLLPFIAGRLGDRGDGASSIDTHILSVLIQKQFLSEAQILIVLLLDWVRDWASNLAGAPINLAGAWWKRERGWGRGRDAECDVAAFSVLFPRKMAILCTSKSRVDWIAMKWSHGNLQIGSASVPSPSWNPSHHALLQIPTASLPISTESPFSLRGISLPINFLLYSV